VANVKDPIGQLRPIGFLYRRARRQSENALRQGMKSGIIA